MNSQALRSVAMFLWLGVLLFPFTVRGEGLSAFTAECEIALEIPPNSITGFTCTVGSEVLPTKQFGKECDSQALLGNGCVANSRLGVESFSNPDVKAVWVCRKYADVDNPNNDVFHDIAMIVHNRKNGKTCFFQNDLDPTSDGPVVPTPRDSVKVWKDPKATSELRPCTSCHINDPFIITPHVAEAFRTFGMTRFNPNGLYEVVGQDFASFGNFIKKEPGCGGMCHFNPVQDFVNDAIDKDKLWMPPGHRENYTPYNFNPIGGQFYVLRSTGEVRGLNGPSGGACNNGVCPHWSVLGNNPNTAEIAASAGKLYSREIFGTIREFTGVQCIQSDNCPEWTKLDTNPNSAQIVSGAGILYQMRHDGSIWRHTGAPCVNITLPIGSRSFSFCPGWQMLDNNSETIEIVASNTNLYQRHKNGNIWKFTDTACSGNSCPGWQLIASDPRTIDLVAGGSALYMFQQLGAIWKYTGTPCDSSGCPGWQLVAPDNNGNTKQVVAGSGELYRLDTNGEIWRYLGTGLSWEKIDSFPNNVEIGASINGLLVRHSAGDVWRFTNLGWMQIQNLTNTIAITGARP